jgi:hypothetical protein
MDRNRGLWELHGRKDMTWTEIEHCGKDMAGTGIELYRRKKHEQKGRGTDRNRGL